MELPPADKTSLFDKTKPIVSEEEWRDLGLLIIFLTRIEVNDCQQHAILLKVLNNPGVPIFKVAAFLQPHPVYFSTPPITSFQS